MCVTSRSQFYFRFFESGLLSGAPFPSRTPGLACSSLRPCSAAGTGGDKVQGLRVS